MKYAICATGRTRSHFLCNLLCNLNVGTPDEYPANEIKDPIDHKRFMLQTIRRNFGGMSLQPGSKPCIEKYLNLATFFDKFIHLRHPDPIWQAISLLRATKTGNFHAFKSHPDEKRDPRSDAIWQMEITHEEIFELMKYVISMDKKWMSFFQENNIEPLTIWYHELGTHEQQICTLKKILDFLGIYKPINLPRDYDKQMFVQSDAWNEKVYEDFLLNFEV